MITLKVLNREPSSSLGNILRDTTVGKSYACVLLAAGLQDPYGNYAKRDVLMFNDDKRDVCVVSTEACTKYEVTHD